MSPLASVVIVTYGKRHLIERCLESLEHALGPKLGTEWEVVVVDNDSPDDTADLLREWSDRIEVVLLDRNLNYAGGNNIGAQAARGEVVVFLNNDTEVPAGSLEALVETAREPGVGGVGTRLLYPDGTIQHGGVAWRRDPVFYLQAFHLFQHEAGDLPAARATFDLDIVTGACFATRRELFLELGGFDEGYVNGYEDVDLCLRARVAGHRIVYRGDVHVVHNESATRGHNWDMSGNDKLMRGRWEQMLEEDSELIASVFGGRIDHGRQPAYALATPSGSKVAVEGQVSGLAPESAEARGLLRALELAGLTPAMRDWQDTVVAPQFTDEGERELVAVSRRRAVAADAVRVHVPVGRHAHVPPGAVNVVRLAWVPDALPLGTAVWAATPKLADELVAAGLPRDLVEVVAPPLAELPQTTAGGGLLFVVPGHDTAWTRAALAGVERFDGRVRVLPSVANGELAALAPYAEILSPVSCEVEFARIASVADVVLCADPTDVFQRRALVAAALGAAVVTAAGGAAEHVLGDALCTSLDGAVERIGERAERAARVAAACFPAAVASRLPELVERARRAGYLPLRSAA